MGIYSINEKETTLYINKLRKERRDMTKKLVSGTVRVLNDLTSVKFVLGVLTGSSMIAIMLGSAVGLF